MPDAGVGDGCPLTGLRAARPAMARERALGVHAHQPCSRTTENHRHDSCGTKDATRMGEMMIPLVPLTSLRYSSTRRKQQQQT
jgi:hypothetical protein